MKTNRFWTSLCASLGFLLWSVCLLPAAAQSTKDKSREAEKDKTTGWYGYEWNLEDKEDTWCIVPQYEEAAKYFSENLAGIQLNGRVGYIDVYNRMVILPQYDADDDLKGFSQGLSAVKKDGKYGFIDKTGAFVIEPQFDKAENFDEKLVAVVKKDGKVGLIDLLGEEILPCKYLTVEVMRVAGFGKTYKKALNQVKANKDAGQYDEVLQRIEQANAPIEAQVRDADFQPVYPTGRAPFEQGGRWGLKGEGDETVVPAEYDEIVPIDSPFFLLSKEGKWGVCDVYGRFILRCLYDFVAYEAASGVFQVKQGEYIGATFRDGVPIVVPSFDYVGSFATGLAQVWSGSTEGSVSLEGKVSKGLSDKLLVEAHLVASEGDDVTARQLYERVVQIDRRCGMAYICLGVLEVDAQMEEQGLEHIKKGGKVSKDLSKIASHNVKEAKKPMGQRNWIDGRTSLAYAQSKESGEAQMDRGMVDSKFAEELSAQAQSVASSLEQNSASQQHAKACCAVLNRHYKALQEASTQLTSEGLKQAYANELARLERLITSKGGVLE